MARLLLAGRVVVGCGAADLQSWQSGIGFRWAALEGPTGEGVGFSLISPEQTGITFTNRLEEKSSAANRVLEDGSGVAVGDVDRDERLDIFFCSLTGQNALYRNLGYWKFEEVSSKVGLGSLNNAVCRGGVFADGWPDLLVSALGRGVLVFLNDRQGKFIQTMTGTEGPSGSMTMALADYDGNGSLDLYGVNYRTDDIRDRSRIDVQRANGQVTVAPEFRDRLLLSPDGLLEFGEPDVLYRNDGRGHFTTVSGEESGVRIYGEQRGAALCDFDEDGRVDLAVAQNGADTKLFRNAGARPGLRVRLRGCAGNPTGIGTQLRLEFGQEMGPVREVHAGSGYGSQDSAVQVLGAPKPPTRIEVRWPGGKVRYRVLAPNAKEVVLDEECGTGRDAKP